LSRSSTAFRDREEAWITGTSPVMTPVCEASQRPYFEARTHSLNCNS
jgi:hypothetical protein